MKRKVGIYGGSFNPIHYGHVELGRFFLREGDLDEIWYVVSPHNPLKDCSTLLDDNLRLQMVEEALKDEPRLCASDYEFHLPHPSYMWNTLQSLSCDYPDCLFTLLIGGDNWTVFNKWYHSEDILSNYQICIYPRKGDDIDSSSLPSNVSVLCGAPLINISSTEIRERLRKGLPVRDYVPNLTEHAEKEMSCQLARNK